MRFCQSGLPKELTSVVGNYYLINLLPQESKSGQQGIFIIANFVITNYDHTL